MLRKTISRLLLSGEDDAYLSKCIPYAVCYVYCYRLVQSNMRWAVIALYKLVRSNYATTNLIELQKPLTFQPLPVYSIVVSARQSYLVKFNRIIFQEQKYCLHFQM